ncbi:OmpA family protein [Promicromonospora sp. CA-289599]|uniref:OmpA family protein n=1 Tax=Promicromonospora sp. CA-289599 TaxID=3240014 RepID=UPI003D924B63
MLVLTITPIVLAGCGNDAAEPPDCVGDPQSIVFAVGGRQNSPVPQLSKPAIDLLADAVDSCGEIGIVGIDGQPTFTGWLTDAGDVRDAKTQEWREIAISEYVNEVVGTTLPRVVADEPEAAPLAALEVAALSLGDVDEDHKRTIILVDSGLQTVDPFSFVTDFSISSEPSDAANYLKDDVQDLPDLTGLEVVWVGMGQTAAPQPDLTVGQRADLESIWRAVIERTGATVEFQDVPAGRAPSAKLPAVTVVPVAEPPPPPPTPTCETVTFKDATVKFVPDQATFLRPTEVDTILSSWAEQISTSDLQVHLIGTTATGTSQDKARDLSQRRAAAVRRVLIDQGVDSRRVTSEGQGWWDRWHIHDWEDEQRIPEPAARNRKVVMLLSGEACA